MNNRVLFVDDEPNVLDGIRRQLRNRVEIETATGAAAGLALIASKGPFAVVVSDMRMPEMNGARFLARVHEIAPQTIRMVLTGQSDMDSTLAAVNEGQVFRFLMKPCDAETLLGVITSGIEQYRLVHAEKNLLENTLNATVRVLVEVLGLINPGAQRRASQIERYADAASTALNLPNAWKYHLAAMLSQLGCITLPAETLMKVHGGQALSDEEKQLYDQHPEVAGQLLSKIPRLEDVAAMVAGQLRPPGKELAGGNAGTWNPQALGAAILWAAARFDQIVGQGKTPAIAAQQIRQLAPELPPAVIEAMLKSQPSRGSRLESRSVTVRNLAVGMVLEADLVSAKGIRLVPKGTEVTNTLLDRIRTIANGVGVAEPIRVSVMILE